MIYYGGNDYRDYVSKRNSFGLSPFLAHHGIKGQKKGVRNGPPYPLTREAHSKAEEKANWQSSLKHKEKDDWTKYDVVYKPTGEIFHLTGKVRNPQTFAGYGTKAPLDEETVNGLCREFPNSEPEKWAHRKGIGTVDYYGEEADADIHWFQEEHVGKQKFKIKKWVDE